MSGDKISSEDVEQVALLRRAVCDPGQFVKRGMVRAVWHSGEESEDLASWQARAILAALAGRLLPAGGEERTEWRTCPLAWGECEPMYGPSRSEEFVASRVKALRGQGWPSVTYERRTVTEWPDGSVLTGPWLPVEEGTQL